MKNLGIAKVKVNLYEGLPNIDRTYKRYGFDMSAFQWDAFCSSNLFPPIFLEQIQDNNMAFGAIHPSKRKWWIDNYMKGSGNLAAALSASSTSTSSGASSTAVTKPYITWSPISNQANIHGLFSVLLTGGTTTGGTGSGGSVSNPYPTYPNLSYVGNKDLSSNWNGPVWDDIAREQVPMPDDARVLNNFLNTFNFVDPNDRYDPAPLNTILAGSTAASGPIPSIRHIKQSQPGDGLWWAVESNPFLTDNMPFWVTIKKEPCPPTSNKYSTYIVIRMENDPENTFDIAIGMNLKPVIWDYTLPVPPSTSLSAAAPATSTFSTNALPNEFINESSRVLDSDNIIEVGIMTAGGRLIVIVNGDSYVYTRIDKGTSTSAATGGTLKECKIVAGKVLIYGTNIPVEINVSPMIFAPQGIMVLPIPQYIQPGDTDANNDGTMWRGVDYKGDSNNLPVCALPTPPSTASSLVPQRFGCDCNLFTGVSGNINPINNSSNIGFHIQGKVIFKKGGPTKQDGMGNIDYYYLSMMPGYGEMMLDNGGSGTPYPIPYGGCPYFFQIKGVFVTSSPPAPPTPIDVSDYVISVSEQATASDYFHIKKTATITLYNPFGEVSDSSTSGQMFKYQLGVDISWSWGNDPPIRTFIGLITNVNSSEIAGKEILTVSCSDYMYILNNIPIINSPFYDGMVAYWAVAELATRAGIAPSSFKKLWDNENDYFLPAGLSYSQPAMRFPASQKIFECIINIVKRFEAFVYFDGNGNFNICKLPGGLFSVVTEIPIEFYSDISLVDTDGGAGLVLNERNVDFNFDSTVNSISVYTLDRETKNSIVYGTSATDDRLLFPKPYLYDQAALGDIDTAKAHAADLGQRIFYPILKTRFTCAGNKSTTMPLSFITLDGQNFRLTSVKRDFSAETNDFKASFECEWLGGGT